MGNYRNMRKHYDEIRRIIVDDIMLEEERKAKGGYVHNSEMFSAGELWFNQGHTLEEADDKNKNNASFIRGYNKARRVKIINDGLYAAGVEHFMSGMSLDTAHKSYLTSEHFIKGYEDAEAQVMAVSEEKTNSRR